MVTSFAENRWCCSIGVESHVWFPTDYCRGIPISDASASESDDERADGQVRNLRHPRPEGRRRTGASIWGRSLCCSWERMRFEMRMADLGR